MKKIVLLSLFIVLLLTGCVKSTTTTITFELDGGSGITESVLTKGTVFMEPDDPIKEDHMFKGWFTDESFVNLYDFSNEVDDDFVLYAKWVEDQFELSFADKEGNIIEIQLFSYGDDLTNIEIPELEGYISVGNGALPSTMPDYDLEVSPYLSETKITGSDIDEPTYFGTDIITIGDYIFVQAIQASTGDQFIYIYSLTDPSYERKLPSTYDDFSTNLENAITIDGDYIIVKSKGSFSGSIHIYKFSDSSYERTIEKLSGDEITFEDWKVEISGDYIIMGMIAYNEYQGAVYVFKISDPSYERIITGSNSIIGDRFGENLIVENNFIVVYDFSDNDSSKNFYVYKLNDPSYFYLISKSFEEHLSVDGNSLMQLSNGYLLISGYTGYGDIYLYNLNVPSYERIITGLEQDLIDEYGRTTYIEGDYIIVKALADEINDHTLYIYKISDPSYELKISEDNFTFGYDLFIKEDEIIILSKNESYKEITIYLYKFSDTDYKVDHSINREDVNDQIKFEVYLHNDYLIINSVAKFLLSEGMINIYKFSDPSYERVLINPDDTNDYSAFGSRILMQDDYLLVGDFYYNEVSGKAYLYKLSDEEFIYEFIGSDLTEDSFFGYDFIIKGNIIIICAPSSIDLQGAIYIYDVSEIE